MGGLWLCQPAGWSLRLVGSVEVRRIGTVEGSPVGSRKARTLLAFLGARGAEKVRVPEIAQAVWGDRQPRDPAANVATLVSRLRARFGVDVVLGTRTGYRLGEIRVDLHEAAELVGKAEKALARAQPAFALLAAEQVIKLIGDDEVLIGHDAVWADEARTTQKALLRRAWQLGAEGAGRTGAPRLARAMAQMGHVAS